MEQTTKGKTMTPQEIDTRIHDLLNLKAQAKFGNIWEDENGKPLNSFFITPDMRATKAEEIQNELDELESLYTGWTRYQLVSGGKLHSFEHCQTLDKWNHKNATRNSTARAYVYEISGMSWEEAEEHMQIEVCQQCKSHTNN